MSRDNFIAISKEDYERIFKDDLKLSESLTLSDPGEEDYDDWKDAIQRPSES